MDRWAIRLTLLGLLAAAVAGCGPAVSTSNFGRVLYEVPDVKAAEKPYEFPDKAPPTKLSDRPR